MSKISNIDKNRTNIYVRQKVAKIVINEYDWWNDNDLLEQVDNTFITDTMANNKIKPEKQRKRGHRYRKIWKYKRSRLGRT